MRRILVGIVVGAFVAFAIIFALQSLAATLWPLPAGVDPNTPAGAQGMTEQTPLAARLLLVAAWCLGSLAGGAIAARMAHRWLAAWIVAAIVVTRACTTIADITRPGWMVACGVLLPCICAWAVRGAARRHPH